MARPLRIEYPGAFYHVINRGNAGENIFKGKRDKEKFLEYLEMAIFWQEVSAECHAKLWANILVEYQGLRSP